MSSALEGTISLILAAEKGRNGVKASLSQSTIWRHMAIVPAHFALSVLAVFHGSEESKYLLASLASDIADMRAALILNCEMSVSISTAVSRALADSAASASPGLPDEGIVPSNSRAAKLTVLLTKLPSTSASSLLRMRNSPQVNSVSLPSGALMVSA